MSPSGYLIARNINKIYEMDSKDAEDARKHLEEFKYDLYKAKGADIVSTAGGIDKDNYDVSLFNYYANIYKQIQSCGGCVSIETFNNEAEAGAANDNEWLNQQVLSGRFTIESYSVDSNGILDMDSVMVGAETAITYSNNTEIDKTELARAEAEYEKAMKEKLTHCVESQIYGDLNPKQTEYINDIKVSGTHLLGMINEILDMSKIEAHAMKIVKSTFPISRALTEVCNILLPLAQKKNIHINAAMAYDFDVFADYQKIQQILYNLVSNAIKYSPENDEIEIAVVHAGDKFQIAVHDNGIGIDPKYHGKIFAKFVQLDSAYTKKESSTGLGLTITKELVELHGGKISLISEVNNGSTFIVEIPILIQRVLDIGRGVSSKNINLNEKIIIFMDFNSIQNPF